MKSFRYDDRTRKRFDEQTTAVLDALSRHYGIVEIEPPKCPDAPNACWLVQVYETADAELPTGLMGDTPYQAAERLAEALRVELKDA